MIDLITCFRKKDRPIRLNKEFHLDLQWCDLLLAEWHGVSFWLYPRLSPAVDLEAASNAAGSIGFGSYFKGFWFAGPWAVSQRQQSIAYKELFPVVVAAHVWGPQWSKKHVLSRSNNDAWSTGWSGGPQRFRPSCNTSAVSCSLRYALTSPFQLNTSQVSTIKSLMLFLVSVGRNFDGWPQPIPPQLLSELTNCL